MAPHPPTCGGPVGMLNSGAAGEEDAAGGAGFGAAVGGIDAEEAEIVGGRVGTGGEVEAARGGGAVAAGLFRPSLVPPRPLPFLPDPRRPESAASGASMAGRSTARGQRARGGAGTGASR
jgi:hypothetical protein